NGSKEPADGAYWVFDLKIKEKDETKTITVVVGEVDDAAVEAKVTNRQRAYINLMAILVVLVVTAILVKGISESAGLNALTVIIKVVAVVFVIVVGTWLIIAAGTEHWSANFAPFGWTGISFFGIPVAGQENKAGEPVGVIAGAAIIFFAYIGFDS